MSHSERCRMQKKPRRPNGERRPRKFSPYTAPIEFSQASRRLGAALNKALCPTRPILPCNMLHCRVKYTNPPAVRNHPHMTRAGTVTGTEMDLFPLAQPSCGGRPNHTWGIVKEHATCPAQFRKLSRTPRMILVAGKFSNGSRSAYLSAASRAQKTKKQKMVATR